MEVYEKTGTQGTVRAVIRAVPVAVLKPMIGATEAVSQTLLGLRNSIDPNKKLQTEDVCINDFMYYKNYRNYEINIIFFFYDYRNIRNDELVLELLRFTIS